MTALIVYFFAALFISFICSLLESVLLSVSHAHIAVLVKEGSKRGYIMASLKENINRPLSAILTINTIANTVGAAGVGAEATKLFGHASLGIISATLTLLILIFSEIIPKTLGAIYCKSLSKVTFYSIKLMMILTYPLVFISLRITQLFSKKKNQIISREELSAMANLGFDEGVFSKDENRIIQNIINLKNIKVTEI